jgi:hypothetical protein
MVSQTRYLTTVRVSLQVSCLLTFPFTYPHLLEKQGLELARLADLPEDVMIEAKRVAEYLSDRAFRQKTESQSNKIAIRRKALLRVKFS